jgi:hypothetical protein
MEAFFFSARLSPLVCGARLPGRPAFRSRRQEGLHELWRNRFTPLVSKLQELYGSRAQYEGMEKSDASQDRLTELEKKFLAGRDIFYRPRAWRDGPMPIESPIGP